MAAATERMTDMVQDNSQASVLTQVVEWLQLVLATPGLGFRPVLLLQLPQQLSRHPLHLSGVHQPVGVLPLFSPKCEKSSSPNLSHKKEVQPELPASQNL